MSARKENIINFKLFDISNEFNEQQLHNVINNISFQLSFMSICIRRMNVFVCKL